MRFILFSPIDCSVTLKTLNPIQHLSFSVDCVSVDVKPRRSSDQAWDEHLQTDSVCRTWRHTKLRLSLYPNVTRAGNGSRVFLPRTYARWQPPLCVFAARAHACLSAPPSPNCICDASLSLAAESAKPGLAAIGALPLCRCPGALTRPDGHSTSPLSVLPRISEGAAPKSNRALLHRIPLATQFGFTQAHTAQVIFIHSEKEVRPRFLCKARAPIVGNSAYLPICVSRFTAFEGDLK